LAQACCSMVATGGAVPRDVRTLQTERQAEPPAASQSISDSRACDVVENAIDLSGLPEWKAAVISSLWEQVREERSLDRRPRFEVLRTAAQLQDEELGSVLQILQSQPDATSSTQDPSTSGTDPAGQSGAYSDSAEPSTDGRSAGTAAEDAALNADASEEWSSDRSEADMSVNSSSCISNHFYVGVTQLASLMSVESTERDVAAAAQNGAVQRCGGEHDFPQPPGLPPAMGSIAESDVTATTISIKRLRKGDTIETVQKMIDAVGFAGKYRFLFAPVTLAGTPPTYRTLGFATVDFADHATACQFLATAGNCARLRQLQILWARVQGSQRHIDLFAERAQAKGLDGMLDPYMGPWTFEVEPGASTSCGRAVSGPWLQENGR